MRIERGPEKALFRSFYTSNKKGTGLGLVIAKKMMQNMGGDIKIESTLGTGTTVELSLKKGERHAIRQLMRNNQRGENRIFYEDYVIYSIGHFGAL